MYYAIISEDVEGSLPLRAAARVAFLSRAPTRPWTHRNPVMRDSPAVWL